MVYLTGRPVDALNAWLDAAKIDSGSVFRAIDRWGNVSRRALDPKVVNDIIKPAGGEGRARAGGVSEHGLRSGYLTEAANRAIPLPEAMEQSRHRSIQQASSYYNNATRRSGRATRMLWLLLTDMNLPFRKRRRAYMVPALRTMAAQTFEP